MNCTAAQSRGEDMKAYERYLRWLYRGKRPHWFARMQNRVSAAAFGAGIWPKRVAALDIVGRRSSRMVTFPVVIAELDGGRYLVSMLGERANWVRNLRADDGRAVLRHGRREAVRLEEVPVAQRPAILRRYLELAPGGRPHVPVDRHAPLEEFEPVAAQIPVFRIRSAVDARSRQVAEAT